MSQNEIIVIAASLAAIAWINRYFFLSRRRPAAAALAEGQVQSITVAVRGTSQRIAISPTNVFLPLVATFTAPVGALTTTSASPSRSKMECSSP